MDAAGLIEYEKVHVLNINNGERIETYVIKGERGSGIICLNGAAARKFLVGDIIIIATYVVVDDAEAKSWIPKCVHLDGNNNIKPRLSKSAKSRKTAKSIK